jgi:hypothetical protein
VVWGIAALQIAHHGSDALPDIRKKFYKRPATEAWTSF